MNKGKIKKIDKDLLKNEMLMKKLKKKIENLQKIMNSISGGIKEIRKG